MNSSDKNYIHIFTTPSRTPFEEYMRRMNLKDKDFADKGEVDSEMDTMLEMYKAGIVDEVEVYRRNMEEHKRKVQKESEEIFTYGLDVTQPESHGVLIDPSLIKYKPLKRHDGQESISGSVRDGGGRRRSWWERVVAYFDWLLGGKDRRGTAYW